MSAPKALSEIDLQSLDKARIAVFLDFDGTLVEFAAHPQDVRLKSGVREDIAGLAAQTAGALAIVTGRPIAEIDGFLAPLHVPVAGVHGMSRRDSTGQTHETSFDPADLARLRAPLQAFVAGRDGLLLEEKPGSLALHYRRRPELEDACRAAVAAALDSLDHPEDMHVMRGKMVIEVRAGAKNKGQAIAEFMAEAPFAGRTPLFAGDDVTDEDAFAEVNRRGGITVKVGPGETCALYRAASIADFHCWLERLKGAAGALSG